MLAFLQASNIKTTSHASSIQHTNNFYGLKVQFCEYHIIWIFAVSSDMAYAGQSNLIIYCFMNGKTVQLFVGICVQFCN